MIPLLLATSALHNKSGVFFPLVFENSGGTRFATLHVPNADDAGWGLLPRVQ